LFRCLIRVMSTFSFDFQCKKKRECMDYHWKKVGFERLTYGNVEKIITTVSQITDFISQILVIKVSFGTWTWMIWYVTFAILLNSHWNQFKKQMELTKIYATLLTTCLIFFLVLISRSSSSSQIHKAFSMYHETQLFPTKYNF
jgi:hypothetical protein